MHEDKSAVLRRDVFSLQISGVQGAHSFADASLQGLRCFLCLKRRARQSTRFARVNLKGLKGDGRGSLATFLESIGKDDAQQFLPQGV